MCCGGDGCGDKMEGRRYDEGRVKCFTLLGNCITFHKVEEFRTWGCSSSLPPVDRQPSAINEAPFNLTQIAFM